jgi:hypothetical protein
MVTPLRALRMPSHSHLSQELLAVEVLVKQLNLQGDTGVQPINGEYHPKQQQQQQQQRWAINMSGCTTCASNETLAGSLLIALGCCCSTNSRMHEATASAMMAGPQAAGAAAAAAAASGNCCWEACCKPFPNGLLTAAMLDSLLLPQGVAVSVDGPGLPDDSTQTDLHKPAAQPAQVP